MDPNPNSPYRPYFPPEIFGENYSSPVNLSDDDTGDAISPAMSPADSMGNKGGRGGGGRGGGGSRVGRSMAAAVGYTEAEMEALTRAWVDTSQDPIIGNGQKKSSYWTRIKEAYAAIKPDGTPERNEQMLRTHWDRVKIALAEFQQLYKECEMNMGSGQGDVDVLTRAMNEWQRMKCAPFKHLETWQLVKDTPKFATVFSAKFKLDEAAKRTKTREDGSYTTSASESGRSTPSSTPEFSSRAERPIGRDAAKGKRKVGSSSTDSDMSAAHLAAAELHAMKLDNATAVMQSAVTSYNILNAYPIFMRDTSNITPDEKARHEEYVEMIKRTNEWN